MGVPKRKQSKTRSRKRRGSNHFKILTIAYDKNGTLYIPHKVNPLTGIYRGHKVIDLKS